MLPANRGAVKKGGGMGDSRGYGESKCFESLLFSTDPGFSARLRAMIEFLKDSISFDHDVLGAGLLDIVFTQLRFEPRRNGMPTGGAQFFRRRG